MNVEPIRALLESAKAAAVKPTFGDHPDALAFAEMRTTEFAKAAIPALSQLLEAVEGMERMSKEHGANCRKGEFTRSIVGPGDQPEEYPCTCGADDLKRLLHPEDK